MSTNQKLTKSYSGIFGHQVVLKNRRGKSVMTIPPVRPKVEPTEKQVAVRERLKLAVLYAQNVLKDPALLALYAAKSVKGLTPYKLAVNDYLRLPYIHKVDASGYHGNTGDKITVTAGDDFRLDSVTVKISHPDGSLIEEGACVFNMPSGSYDYTTTVQVSALAGVIIIARAKDTPGNVTEHSVTL
jgi:hypothetical protein